MFHFLRRNGQDGDQAVDPEAHAGAETAPPRPSIGLVLGGGAARGFAHIGVQLWRTEDGPDGAVFEILVARSMAGSFWCWFAASAAEFGCSVDVGRD